AALNGYCAAPTSRASGRSRSTTLRASPFSSRFRVDSRGCSSRQTLRRRRRTTHSSSSLRRQRGPRVHPNCTLSRSRPTSGSDRLSMRILILNWKDRAHPAAGGAETFTENVAEELVERGHEVTLFAARVDGRPDSEDVNGVGIVRG